MKKIWIFILLIFTMVGCSNNKKIINYNDIEIMSAINSDNSEMVNKILNSGVPVDYRFKNGDTLVGLTLKNDSLEVLRVLLKHKINLNEPIPSVKILGTDSLSPAQTPIFYVKSLEALKMVVNSGANINCINSEGTPLLTYFIKYKPMDYSVYLVENGADLNIKDKEEWTPVFWASIEGNERLLKIMYQQNPGSFLSKDKKGNYPIYYAFGEENINSLLEGQYNIDAKNIYGENILGEVYLKSVANGYISSVEKLFNLGINRNYKSYGENALNIAEKFDNQLMYNFLKEKGVK